MGHRRSRDQNTLKISKGSGSEIYGCFLDQNFNIQYLQNTYSIFLKTWCSEKQQRLSLSQCPSKFILPISHEKLDLLFIPVQLRQGSTTAKWSLQFKHLHNTHPHRQAVIAVHILCTHIMCFY